jgi:mycofactocin precursor
MRDPSGRLDNCPFGGCLVDVGALTLVVPTTPGGNLVPDTENDLTAADLIDETLVEEVSIDGMCGVY